MHYLLTIVYNVTSGNAISLLGMAQSLQIHFWSQKSFEISEGRLNVSLFLWKTNN